MTTADVAAVAQPFASRRHELGQPATAPCPSTASDMPYGSADTRHRGGELDHRVTRLAAALAVEG